MRPLLFILGVFAAVVCFEKPAAVQGGLLGDLCQHPNGAQKQALENPSSQCDHLPSDNTGTGRRWDCAAVHSTS